MYSNPVSLSEWPFYTGGNDSYLLKISSTGNVAVSHGQILTIFLKFGMKWEPYFTVNPHNSRIVAMAWCQGLDAHGQSPPYLAFATEAGHLSVFDVSTTTFFSVSEIEGGYCTVLVWDEYIATDLIVSTTHSMVCKFSVVKGASVMNWSIKTTFVVDFLSISPFNQSLLLLASKTGQFLCAKFTSNASGATSNVGSAPTNLLDAYFYPYLEDCAVLVYSQSICLYMINGNYVLEILRSQDILRNVFFTADYSYIIAVTPTLTEVLKMSGSSIVETKYIRNLSTPFLASHFCGDTLAVLSGQGCIQFSRFINRKLWSTFIYRGILSSPSCCDIEYGNIIFGYSNGSISMTDPSTMPETEVKSCSMKLCWSICTDEIEEIKLIAPLRFLAVAKDANSMRKLLLVDIATRTVTHVLHKHLENFVSETFQLSTSGDYAALVIDRSTLLFFHIGETSATQIGLYIGVDLVGGFIAPGEFWAITKNWLATKYHLAGQQVDIARVSQFSVPKGRIAIHTPVVCTCIATFIVVGTVSGEVIIFDSDSGVAAKIVPVLKKAVRSFEIGPDRFKCIVRGGKRAALMSFKGDGFDFVKFATNTPHGFIKWIDTRLVLVQTASCLSCASGSDLSPKKSPCATIFLDHCVLKTSDFRRDAALKAAKSGNFEQLPDLGYPFAYEMYSVLHHRAIMRGYATGRTQAECQSFVNHIRGILRASSFRKRKVRLALIVEDYQDAIMELVSTPPTDSHFGLAVIKASLCGQAELQQAITPAIAALNGGGWYSDAVDLLMLTGQWDKAGEQLVSNGELQDSIFVNSIWGKDANIKDAVCARLIKEKNLISAVLALIGFGDPVEGAQVLADAGHVFLSKLLTTMS